MWAVYKATMHNESLEFTGAASNIWITREMVATPRWSRSEAVDDLTSMVERRPLESHESYELWNLNFLTKDNV